MKNEEIIDKLRAGDSSKIKFAVADIDGVLRGKVVHRDKFFQGLDSGFGFCDVIFGWDANDEAYDNATITGWHTGYPDAQLRLDVSTYRTIPWEDNIPFFLGDFSKDNILETVCPRTLLKKIQKQCVDMGYTSRFTQEFEWFNFKKDDQPQGEKAYVNPRPLTEGMFGYSLLRPSMNSAYFNDLFDLLEKFRVPLEALHTETGPGVYEACTHPHEVLEAADQATLLKTAVKEIAYRHGIMASFMAKWNMHLPGCSGHIHQSLWNRQQDTNLFVDVNDKNGVSELMKSYIAGQLTCMPFILPMYAPTINSFKRLVEGAWAPTTITWGMDNRTTALRVLTVTPKLTRLETRVPGSDTNPFLAMAASLASGLYGIKNNLKLEIAPTVGSGYQDARNGKLATNLKEATDLMRDSEIANSLFGETFVDHFTRTRDWEWRQFSKHVTDWELKQYFEVI
jgi:glutamine synthetase